MFEMPYGLKPLTEMFGGVDPIDPFVEAAARITHEANRAFCRTIGDYSQPEWERAPDWQRDSARNGVQFHLDNPNASPGASHANWLTQKLAEGWVYGPEKDPVRKTHPCCVAYDQLPVEQRAKDYLFRAIVHALAQAQKETA